jgi:hypothetical protein
MSMHRDFRALLDEARGISEFVFAVNVDIRGFSDWSLTVDSAQTAIFVKKIYAKLIGPLLRRRGVRKANWRWPACGPRF